MKKVLFLIPLLIVCFFLFSEDEELRIRVISNSNSESDILYKEEVVKYLKVNIFDGEDLTDEYFESNYKLIEEKLLEKFYDIDVRYEYHNFTNKTYNGNAISDGSYKTLLVIIGDGNGSNWWGSVFEGALQKESTDKISYEWYIEKIRNGKR